MAPRPARSSAKSSKKVATIVLSDSDGDGSDIIIQPSTSKSKLAVDVPDQLEGSADDPKVILNRVRDQFIGTGSCSKCSNSLSPSNDDAVKLSSNSLASKFIARGLAECDSCQTLSCRGCWNVVDNGEQECCAVGRSIVLFEVLSSLDRSYLLNETRLSKPVVTIKSGSAGPAKKKGKTVEGLGSGVGYGSGAQGYNAGNGAQSSAQYSHSLDMLRAELADLQEEGGGPNYYDEDEHDEDDYGGEGEAEYTMMMEDEIQEMEALLAAALEREKLGTVVAEESKEITKAKSFDEEILAGLKIITVILPHPDSPTAKMFDYVPDPSLEALINLSTLTDLLTDLLRNDSVSEWNRRSPVYLALIDLLVAFSDSQVTLSVLFGKGRRDKSYSEGIGAWMKREGGIEWETAVVESTTAKGKGKKRKLVDEPRSVVYLPPLSSYLDRLVTQSRAFGKASVTGDLSDEDFVLISLCGDLQSLLERSERSKKIWLEQQERDGFEEMIETSSTWKDIKGKGKAKRGDEGPVYTSTHYDNACRSLAYEQIELSVESETGEKSFPSFLFNQEIRSTANMKRPSGGFVHLAKELAVLSTNLPAGIWLRVDEARIDCIKVMIAGPESTPYSGGLFEFDVYIPITYPQNPPLVKIKTTGGGRVRFNPNLYADGKVCLSVLNTWSGDPSEMWLPNSSTLLQVLLSIQSMILGTALPYFNEPGFGAPKANQKSKDYNQNVSLATVRWAILPWLDPINRDGIWGDVITTHFQLQRTKIESTLKAWALKDGRIKKWQSTMDGLAGGANIVQSVNASAAAAHAQAIIAAAHQHTFGKAAPPVLPPPPASPATRDLIAEWNVAIAKLDTWRSIEWIKGKIEV